MPDQQSLFDDELPPVARARTTDPDTSHAAAESLDPDVITRNQGAVLRLFEGSDTAYQGGLTDAALVTVYEARMAVDPEHFPQQSPSGLRTRRKELTQKGRLRDSGNRVRLDSGRLAIEWVVNR